MVDAPNGQSGTQYITSINNALQTISDYANSTSDYGEISSDLAATNAALEAADAQVINLSNLLSAAPTTSQLAAATDALALLIENVENALANVTTTSPTGQTLPDVSAGGEQVGNAVMQLVFSYNQLVTLYNNLYATNNDLAGQINQLNELNNYTDAQLLEFIENIENGVITELEAEGIPVNATELNTYVTNQITADIEAGSLWDVNGLNNAINQYITNFIAGQQPNAQLTSYIEGVVSDAVAEATSTLVTPTDVMMSQADYDQALLDAADAAIANLIALGIPVTQAELDAAIQEYISTQGLIYPQEVMMTTQQFNVEVQTAIAEYITENGLLTPEAADELADVAVTEALEGYVVEGTIPEGYVLDDGVTQADVDAVQALLTDAEAEIATLIDLLNDGAGTNEVSNETLQAAYDLIDQMEAEAEAQFQVYADDIAAYENFLSSLSSSMTTLENFLTNNYGYDPNTGSASFTIPTNTGDVSFDGSMPLPDIYLNFAGKTIGVTRGFRNFKGVAPMRNANGTFESGDATFELNESTRKILWGAGIVIFTLGAFKLIKTK